LQRQLVPLGAIPGPCRASGGSSATNPPRSRSRRYRDEIDPVVAATKPAKHGLRTLVKQVVLSDLFRTK
jgi:hypothetical protein